MKPSEAEKNLPPHIGKMIDDLVSTPESERFAALKEIVNELHIYDCHDFKQELLTMLRKKDTQ